MIKIDRRTLFDIIDGYGWASSSTVNTNRNYQTYNPYLTPAQWATTQWVTNNPNSTISSIDTGSYTLDTEMLYRHFNTSLDPNAFAVIIDECLPQKEITEEELLNFLNGKGDSDADR